MNTNQQLFAQTTHCICGRCFCGTPKMQAVDGRAICPNCKPDYDRRINEIRVQQSQQTKQG